MLIGNVHLDSIAHIKVGIPDGTRVAIKSSIDDFKNNLYGVIGYNGYRLLISKRLMVTDEELPDYCLFEKGDILYIADEKKEYVVGGLDDKSKERIHKAYCTRDTFVDPD